MLFFLAGQVLAYFFKGFQRVESFLILIVIAIVLVGLIAILSKRYRKITAIAIILSSVIIGACSQIFRFPAQQFALSEDIDVSKDEISYQFTVISTPKRKVSQKVSFVVEGYQISNPIDRIRASASAIELPWNQVSGIRNGDRFIAKAKCTSLKKPESIFSYEYLMLRQGVQAICKLKWIDAQWDKDREKSWKEKLRDLMPEMYQYKMEYGLLLSLILGFDSELSVPLENEFKKCGLTHLLVFSGAQISIICVSLMYIFRGIFALISMKINIRNFKLFSDLTSLILAICFSLLVGVGSSTVRAIVACGVTVCADILGTKHPMPYKLLFSLVLLSCVWPSSILEPGVQLTYAALFGIWFGMKAGKGIKGYLFMCFSISLFTNFITFMWFKGISLAGLLINPICAPLVNFASIFIGIPALILLITGWSWGIILCEYFLIGISYFESFVHWMSGLNWAYLNFG